MSILATLDALRDQIAALLDQVAFLRQQANESPIVEQSAGGDRITRCAGCAATISLLSSRGWICPGCANTDPTAQVIE